MNDKILELLKAKGSPVEIAMHIDVFVQENGPKALKQLERVIRQRTRYNEVLDIVQYEKGYDSRRDAEVIIEESTVALESYDADLQTIIDQAGESPVLRSVDRCLWIYVDRNRAKSPAQKIEDFREALQKTVPDALPWIERNFEGKLPFEAIPLEGNLYTPEAVPLFLRPLRAETIRDVLLGNLMDSVYLFLDWRELGMRDPEMCFELGMAGGPHLSAFYYRNDYLGVEQWSRNIVRGNYVHLIALHEQHQRFAKTWDNNLRLQGFAEAFTDKCIRG